MRKSLIALLIGATVLTGCQNASGSAVTTAAATEAATEAATDAETEAATEQEPEVDEDGTQPEADIEQPTLSAEALRAVDESIAAMLETAEVPEETEAVEMPRSVHVETKGFSFDFPIAYEDFKTLVSGFENTQNAIDAGATEEDGMFWWAILKDNMEDAPEWMEYECRELSYGNGTAIAVMWHTTGMVSEEHQDLWMSPNGHYVGEPVLVEELEEAGFEDAVHEAHVRNVGHDKELSKLIGDGIYERVVLQMEYGNWYVSAVGLTTVK